jgi:hypothetical protein
VADEDDDKARFDLEWDELKRYGVTEYQREVILRRWAKNRGSPSDASLEEFFRAKSDEERFNKVMDPKFFRS